MIIHIKTGIQIVLMRIKAPINVQKVILTQMDWRCIFFILRGNFSVAVELSGRLESQLFFQRHRSWTTDAQWQCIFRVMLQYIGGHSTTTWTEFCHFLTPSSLRGQFLYPEHGPKQTFFVPPPPSCPRSYWMTPCPNISYFIFKGVRF